MGSTVRRPIGRKPWGKRHYSKRTARARLRPLSDSAAITDRRSCSWDGPGKERQGGFVTAVRVLLRCSEAVLQLNGCAVRAKHRQARRSENTQANPCDRGYRGDGKH
ncbi:hypothetical protein SKAU_G00048090 [Synaphobranchus kaupii]|uniref:Uncharacterized protein n=1 Tax=Synaphobranchus kaupii TaxID=118154 RepID=A0A9Q1G3H0_SYNKA|nr:hypothetical protein SKAU_G00048090 [Synaphobranchus kaupii]